ncbi:MAG TPA: SIS domain-containing protein [bacterium]|nr:SIS domain-containing protein [bacterium]
MAKKKPAAKKAKAEGVEPRKPWDWLGEGGELALEATGEHPVMYIALGSEPKTEHPFNLHRDIMSIPRALRDTLGNIPGQVARAADRIVKKKITRIIGTGLGTSQFVAMGAAAAFGDFADLDGDQVDSGEFITSRRNWNLPKSAFIVFSGSGRTIDANRAALKAKEGGAYVLAVTSVPHSPLTKISDDVIVCEGGFDTGGSDTFHYATRLAAGMLLAIELGERRTPKRKNFKLLRKQLNGIPGWLDENSAMLDARCRTIAKRYKNARGFITVGGGPNVATAEEFALKFDEMAHIPAKAMCPDRHIHGALGLTDERIVTAVIAAPGPSYPWLRQIAQATVGLKTPSLGIVSEKDTDIARMMDYVIRMPAVDEHIFTVPATFAVQLFPYYCAVELGDINPDCQRSNIPKHARVWMELFPRGSH